MSDFSEGQPVNVVETPQQKVRFTNLLESPTRIHPVVLPYVLEDAQVQALEYNVYDLVYGGQTRFQFLMHSVENGRTRIENVPRKLQIITPHMEMHGKWDSRFLQLIYDQLAPEEQKGVNYNPFYILVREEIPEEVSDIVEKYAEKNHHGIVPAAQIELIKKLLDYQRESRNGHGLLDPVKDAELVALVNASKRLIEIHTFDTNPSNEQLATMEKMNALADEYEYKYLIRLIGQQIARRDLIPSIVLAGISLEGEDLFEFLKEVIGQEGVDNISNAVGDVFDLGQVNIRRLLKWTKHKVREKEIMHQLRERIKVHGHHTPLEIPETEEIEHGESLELTPVQEHVAAAKVEQQLEEIDREWDNMPEPKKRQFAQFIDSHADTFFNKLPLMVIAGNVGLASIINNLTEHSLAGIGAISVGSFLTMMAAQGMQHMRELSKNMPTITPEKAELLLQDERRSIQQLYRMLPEGSKARTMMLHAFLAEEMIRGKRPFFNGALAGTLVGALGLVAENLGIINLPRNELLNLTTVAFPFAGVAINTARYALAHPFRNFENSLGRLLKKKNVSQPKAQSGESSM